MKPNVYIIQIVSLHTFLLVSFFIGVSIVKHVELSKVDSLKIRHGQCCDLTFRAELGVIPILEYLHIIKVLIHANASIMFKDYRCLL